MKKLLGAASLVLALSSTAFAQSSQNQDSQVNPTDSYSAGGELKSGQPKKKGLKGLVGRVKDKAKRMRGSAMSIHGKDTSMRVTSRETLFGGKVMTTTVQGSEGSIHTTVKQKRNGQMKMKANAVPKE